MVQLHLLSRSRLWQVERARRTPLVTAERTNALLLHCSMTWSGREEANLLQFSAFSVPSMFAISSSPTRARDLQESGRTRVALHTQQGSSQAVSSEEATHHHEVDSWAVARLAKKTAARSPGMRIILSSLCGRLALVRLNYLEFWQ